jgi:hypothetical protein
MDRQTPDDFNPYGDPDDMRQSDARDPWTIGAVVLNVIATIVAYAMLQGRNEQRDETQERDIAELKAKSSKDAAQDIQIAVITTQLAIINTGVTEIKSSLEQRK